MAGAGGRVRDLSGKVFLVTGATEGIGKAATLALAARGAELVLVARNAEKGERVAAEIKKKSGNESVTLLLADMSSVADVHRVAEGFQRTHAKLDVLVNNAGGMFDDYRLSADGLEMTFALNHMGYFSLTTALLNILKRTPGARIVSTASWAHQLGKVEVPRIAKRIGRSAGFPAYADSKLANILFTRELARQLKGTGVIANCFHPGYVNSSFGTNNTGLVQCLLSQVTPLFGRTVEKGAETLIWLATSPSVASRSGEYFFDCKAAPASPEARSDAVARRLWELSATLVEASVGRCVEAPR